MADFFQVHLIGTLRNVSDQPVKFSEIGFLFDGYQVAFIYGQTLEPSEEMEIMKGFPGYSENTKVLEVRIKGFERIEGSAGTQEPTTPTPLEEIASDDVEWLATVIASEAGSIFDKGDWVRCTDEERAAVGWTVLNRLRSGNFGQTIKEVVTSPGQYAHNQEPTQEIRELAERLLQGRIQDNTGGATYFFSPISMPKEGESTTGFDVGGGLQEVPGISKKVYFPSWTKQLVCAGDLPNVRASYFMFYRPAGAPSTPSTATSNLAPNPSFEEGGISPIGWSSAQAGIDDFQGSADFRWDSTTSHSGTRSLRISNPIGNSFVAWMTTDFMSVEPTVSYEMSIWIKGINISGNLEAYLTVAIYRSDDSCMSVGKLPLVYNSSSWSLNRRSNVDMPSGAVKVKLLLCLANPKGVNDSDTLWFDDVYFGASATTGTMQTPNPSMSTHLLAVANADDSLAALVKGFIIRVLSTPKELTDSIANDL
jgi:hypothetical protein